MDANDTRGVNAVRVERYFVQMMCESVVHAHIGKFKSPKN